MATRGGKKSESKHPDLDNIVKASDKRYGPGVLQSASEIRQPDRISTGVFTIDFALLGGIPKNRVSMIAGNRSSGKGQRFTDYVCTPDGWVQFKDLRVGEQVTGPDGNPTTVIGIHPRGVLPMYRVSFTDKSSVVVDGDHLWQVQTARQRAKTGNWYVKSTQELMGGRLRAKANNHAKYRIPMVGPVQYVEGGDLPLDPYVLGVLLANGYMKGATFCTNDTDIVDAVAAKVPSEWVVRETTVATSTAKHWLITSNLSSNMGAVRNKLCDSLRSLGLFGKLSRDKFIPPEYLLASPTDRLALLNGLMDCDGSTNYQVRSNGSPPGSSGARFHSYSRHLALGIQELAQSLGGTAVINEKYREEDDVMEQCVSIALPTKYPTFLYCAKKVQAFESNGRREPARSISHIDYEEDCECLCITVAAQDGLYVTEEFLVTHNSSLSSMIITSAQRQQPDEKVVLIDAEHTFESVWAQKLGVDLSNLLVVDPNTGEQAVDLTVATLSTPDVSLVVVDSIAALVPMKEVASSAEDAHMALQSRMVGGMIRRATAAMVNQRRFGHYVTLLFLNQYRASMSSYGSPNALPGGKALEFATSVQLTMRNKENKGKDTNEIESVAYNDHSWTLSKNKICNGPRNGEFMLVRQPNEDTGMQEGQVDDASTVLVYAKKMGLYAGGGSSWKLTLDDEVFTFNKASVATQALRDNPELYWRTRTKLIQLQAEKQGQKQEFIDRIVET